MWNKCLCVRFRHNSCWIAGVNYLQVQQISTGLSSAAFSRSSSTGAEWTGETLLRLKGHSFHCIYHIRNLLVLSDRVHAPLCVCVCMAAIVRLSYLKLLDSSDTHLAGLRVRAHSHEQKGDAWRPSCQIDRKTGWLAIHSFRKQDCNILSFTESRTAILLIWCSRGGQPNTNVLKLPSQTMAVMNAPSPLTNYHFIEKVKRPPEGSVKAMGLSKDGK